MTIKSKKKLRFISLKDIPNSSVKKGMIFEWNNEEQSYTTKQLPWYLTPMISYFEIKKWATKKRGLFKKVYD